MLTVAFLLCQVLQAPRVPQALLIPSSPWTYQEGRQESRRLGVPLVVFVGQPWRSVPGCVTAHEERIAGVPERCVMVGEWHNGRLLTLDEDPPVTVTQEDVRRLLERLRAAVGQRQASPPPVAPIRAVAPSVMRYRPVSTSC